MMLIFCADRNGKRNFRNSFKNFKNDILDFYKIPVLRQDISLPYSSLIQVVSGKVNPATAVKIVLPRAGSRALARNRKPRLARNPNPNPNPNPNE